MTTNGLIYTTATGVNEYLTSISGSSAYFTNLYGNLTPSSLGGVTISQPYNNLIFDTNATTSSYWNVTGNELEGGTSLFRIYNNLTGSPEVEVMGVQDSTSTTTGALVVVGGVGVGNTIHATSMSGSHGFFINLTGINSYLTNTYVNTATGVNSYLTNLVSTNITGTNEFFQYITCNVLTGTTIIAGNIITTTHTGTNEFISNLITSTSYRFK